MRCAACPSLEHPAQNAARQTAKPKDWGCSSKAWKCHQLPLQIILMGQLIEFLQSEREGALLRSRNSILIQLLFGTEEPQKQRVHFVIGLQRKNKTTSIQNPF